MIDPTDPAVQEIIKRNSVPTLEDALILFKKREVKTVSDLWEIYDGLCILWREKKCNSIDWT